MTEQEQNGAPPPGHWVEIHPGSPATRREYVPFHQVARIYQDVDGRWFAVLVDDTEAAIVSSP